MEGRAERVLALVIDLIATNCEQVSQIMIDLKDWCPLLNISRDEVEGSLEELIRRGWARRRVPEVEAAPDLAELNQPYFKITPVGLAQLDKFPEEWFPAASEHAEPKLGQ